MRIGARRRIDIFLNKDGLEELETSLEAVDRLKFKDVQKYKDRLSDAQRKTGEKDALIAVAGNLKDIPVVVCAFEFAFNGGSMGYAVGEKFTRAAQMALDQRRPIVLVFRESPDHIRCININRREGEDFILLWTQFFLQLLKIL